MIKPPFDEKAAQEMVAACPNPFSIHPGEAGLRAVFAVMQRRHFSKHEDAWQHYSSSKQRFYEWKPCVEAAEALISAAEALTTEDMVCCGNAQKAQVLKPHSRMP